MTEILNYEDALRAMGEEPKLGRRYRCPQDGCGRAEHAFAITQDDDEEWRCSACHQGHVALAFVPHELGWNDVRGQRQVFLERSDWSQLADVPVVIREAWAPLRQQARDATDAPSVGEALAILDSLAAQGALLKINNVVRGE